MGAIGLGEAPAATEPPRDTELPKAGKDSQRAEAPAGSRGDSKQVQVIALLRRPNGATIMQLVEATGWQKHTVRGAISGALKKKLGLNVTSEKVEGGERIYRLGR